MKTISGAGLTALLILTVAMFAVLALRNAEMLYCDDFVITELGTRMCQIEVARP